jgi:microcystin-dependent protein
VAEPFLGEIRLTAFDFPAKGWALANGQMMPINQNQALFSLFGTSYGGDGRVNFGLPDLRGRAAMDQGAGFVIGQAGGEAAHTLSMNEMTAHTHPLMASATDGNDQAPAGHVLARTTNNIYTQPAALGSMSPATVTNVGGSQAHNNMQPYLCISFMVALQGIFPSRN